MTAAGRIRKLWGEFQPWAAAQRKIYEGRRDEMIKAQDAKWKAALLKTRAKQDEHHIQKTQLLKEALDDYLEQVRAEWDSRLNRNNLTHADWGAMEPQELGSVEKVLGDGEPSKPAAQNLVAQPPSQSQHQVVPTPNPAPPLTSAARSVNLSTSTASSYTLVSPSEFSTDDEHYDAMGRFITPSATDESEDESRPVPITQFDGWGIGTHAGAGAGWVVSAQASASTQSPHHSPQTGSPEHLSSSSSNKLGYFTHHPAMSRPSIDEAPHKRPPDKDPKGKARVRGPTYIGPHLSSPEDTSESEEDFELFKMQTRITKVYEFHQEAAALDAELAIVLHNERSSKKAIWKEYAAGRVTEHEKRVLKLQAEKEDERKEIVNAERKKRREEIQRRQMNREHIGGTTNALQAGVRPEEWQHAFKKSQTVRLGADRKTFILDDDFENAENDGNETWDTPQIEPSASELHTPILGQNDTVRARKQFVPAGGRGTPSGWRTKQTTSTPTTSLSQQWLSDPYPPAAPSPGPRTVPEWMEATFSGTPLDYSSSYDSESDLIVPGGFPNTTSTPVPPIPSGWGPKKSVSSTSPATSLLRQVLSDPTANSTPVPGDGKKNTTSPPTAVAKAAPPAPEPKPAHISAAPIKKNAKKDRLTPSTATAASHKKFIKVEEEESPTTPTLTAKPNPSSMAKDIMQRGLGYAHMDDELSSTPRPQLFAKRGSIPDYSSDVASTPRAVTRRLGGEASVSSGLASSWTLEAAAEETPWQRMQKAKAQAQAQAQEGEVTPWQRMQKAQAQGQRVRQEEEETLWQRVQKLKMQGQVQQPKPSLAMSQEAWALGMTVSSMEDEGGSMWERQMQAQSAFAQRSTPASVMARGTVTAAPEESLWGRVVVKNQMATMTAQQQQQQARPEETPWERQMRLRAQGALPNTASSDLAKSALHQSTRIPSVAGWGGTMDFELPISRLAQPQPSTHTPAGQIWAPNSSASSHPHMWNPNAQQNPLQSFGMPGSQSAHQFDDLLARRPSGSISYENDVSDEHRAFVSAGMTKGKGKASAAKVTIEEVPDEEGPRIHRGSALPFSSRHLLDIVEPKPSVPSTMFTNIIQFGEEEEEEEYEYYPGMSSTVPTPSTAPTSPPGEIPSLDDEELLEQMKSGNWSTLIEGGGLLAHDVSSEAQAARWSPEPSAKKIASGSQMVDSAKLFSTLESMKPAPASLPKASLSTKAATPPKATTAPKAPYPAPPPPAKSAPTIIEKPEPTAKPANQPKGKAKGKGKGRK
ncbi:hypothetical protein DXG03_005458 [Asterophora parasitica]|uniref:Uncharacterized protein n=1 Tax=Asterophora parasitica TaxID=117018 RepID=A0A9P7G1X8_9AGAR|nr:hypothetical protein DXG03_005458 [Asterophora parasitica]